MDLTKKSLLKHCRKLDLYGTPELNDRLYLHQMGIEKIKNLDEYTGLKVLWLQTNCIPKIENLDHQKNLKHLYLNDNMIESISGLKNLTELDTLNLSGNLIKKVEGLEYCKQLSTLNLSKNKLSDYDSLKELVTSPSITVLDLSNNFIDNENILDIIGNLPNLRVLYLKGNDICGNMDNYRREIICKCKNLTHLDDRPVFDDERRCCIAWKRGGYEEERKEREKIQKEKHEKHMRNHYALARIVEEAKMEDMESDLIDLQERITNNFNIDDHNDDEKTESELIDSENGDSIAELYNTVD